MIVPTRAKELKESKRPLCRCPCACPQQRRTESISNPTCELTWAEQRGGGRGQTQAVPTEEWEWELLNWKASALREAPRAEAACRCPHRAPLRGSRVENPCLLPRGEENLNPKSQGSASWHLAPLSCLPRVWASCRWAPRGCCPLGCVRNIWRLRPTGLGREQCPAPRGF